MKMDFERQVARHKDAVYRQMLRVCGNVEDAEDVLAEATVKAFKAADKLEDPAAFRTWLTMIGKRVCFRLKQKNRSSSALSLEALQAAGVPMPADESLSADEVLVLEQTHQCVLQAFESLPSNYRDVYRMREIESHSAEETARALKLSVANVKARLHRARTKVREALDQALET